MIWPRTGVRCTAIFLPLWAKYGPSCCTAAGSEPVSSLPSALCFFENWVKLLHCKGLKDTHYGPIELLEQLPGLAAIRRSNLDTWWQQATPPLGIAGYCMSFSNILIALDKVSTAPLWSPAPCCSRPLSRSFIISDF